MKRAASDDEKRLCAEAVRQHLQTARALRERARPAPGDVDKRQILRAWQAGRLAHCYADLLASPKFGAAARFFLSDLYGPKDFGSRDHEIERILPLLISLLPLSALKTIELAIEVDALTEQLDAAMVAELDRRGAIDCIDEDSYAAAYRAVGRPDDRERQIVLIGATGDALARLADKPLFPTLLRMMRGPAQAAGLGDLQAFLASGYAAFRHIDDPAEFLGCIEARERAFYRDMFGSAADPFVR